MITPKDRENARFALHGLRALLNKLHIVYYKDSMLDSRTFIRKYLV